MAQQTQIDTLIPYYHRFVEAFPDVTALAEAPEDKVLKLWEGLGYYSRAKNLHKAAKIIHEEYNGIFPDHYDALIKAFPGIGPLYGRRHCQYCFWHSEGRCGRQYTENCCQIV